MALPAVEEDGDAVPRACLGLVGWLEGWFKGWWVGGSVGWWVGACVMGMGRGERGSRHGWHGQTKQARGLAYQPPTNSYTYTTQCLRTGDTGAVVVPQSRPNLRHERLQVPRLHHLPSVPSVCVCVYVYVCLET